MAKVKLMISQNLASLLQLPDSFGVEYASIDNVRVTVPADIFTASIEITIRGVGVRVRLLEDRLKEDNKATPPDDAKPDLLRRRASPRFASPPPSQQRRSSSGSLDDFLDSLPTAHDIAASYLAEETSEEREQLEAVLHTQPADLQQSVAHSEGSDDEPISGIGTTLALPTFLTGFFKGVGERLKITVQDVTINLDLELSRLSEIKSSKTLDSDALPATISFHLDELDVQELSPESPSPARKPQAQTRPNRASTVTPQGIHKTERRHIEIRGIQASLIAESSAFDDAPSESDDASPIKSANSPIASWSEDGGSLGSGRWAMPKSHERTVNTASDHLYKSEVCRRIPSHLPPTMVPNLVTDEADKFADAEEADELGRSESEFMKDSIGDAIDPPVDALIESDHSPSDSETRSQHLHNALVSFREEKSASTRSLRTSQYSRGHSKAPVTSRQLPHSVTVSDDIPNSSDGNPMPTQPSSPVVAQTLDDLLLSPEEVDPLVESKLFSHEEAESIYLSMVEDTSLTDSEYFPMPGGWGDASVAPARPQRSLASVVYPTKYSPNRSTSELYGAASQAQPPGVVDNLQHAANLAAVAETNGLFTNSTRAVSKSFIHLDRADIWISNDKQTDPEVSPAVFSSSNLDQSTTKDVPGTFSSYASLHDADKPRRSTSSFKHTNLGDRADSQSRTKVTQAPQDNTFEIILGLLAISVDFSICRLLAQVEKRLQSTMASKESKKNRQAKHQDGQKLLSALLEPLRLRIIEVELSLVKHVKAAKVYDLVSADVQTRHSLDASDSILKMNISDLEFRVKDTRTFDQVRLDIRNMKIGFGDATLLAFTSDTNSRTSLRDPKKSKTDVSLTLNRMNETLALDIETRPLVLSADLEQLDQMLESFGGFSGLMELGSSTASDVTTTNHAHKSLGASKSVRFEHGTKDTTEPSHAGSLKLNLRIGGATVALNTLRHSIKLQSSAVKIVSRESLFGVQIDSIRLSGPNIVESNTQEYLIVKLDNTSLKYLNAPEERDLTRLIALLTPSKDKFEDDDDFLLDTLLRQRRKGSVLRLNIAKASTDINDLKVIDVLQQLSADMMKLSAITKFLPEESRPGTLTLVSVNNLRCAVNTDSRVGILNLDFEASEIAHVGSPSLIALSMRRVQAKLDQAFQLVGEVVPCSNIEQQPPMLMARMIGDEMEPTARVKLWNTQLGYNVSILTDLLDQLSTRDNDDIVRGLAASVMTLTDRSMTTSLSPNTSLPPDSFSSESSKIRLDLALRDCAISLEPLDIPSRGIFVLTDARIIAAPPGKEAIETTVSLRRASLLVIDNLSERIEPGLTSFTATSSDSATGSNQTTRLCEQGFVSVTSISQAMIKVNLTRGSDGEHDILDIDFKDELFLLETCADSMQTVSDLLGALKPPLPPTKGQKYRTEITPVQDMMASFTGDAFALQSRTSSEADFTRDEFFEDDLVTDFDDLGDMRSIAPRLPYRSGNLQTSAASKYQAFANKWDSGHNKYIPVTTEELKRAPFRLKVRDMHVIWNLHDGYDWLRTRDKITKAVIDVENRAEERRLRTRRNLEEDTDESVIGDFLFNSIYIGVPLDHDPRELTRQINRNMDDLISETGSQTTNTTVRPSSSQDPRRKRLNLDRSKRHKIAFELGKVSVDVFVFPSGGETQSSIDVRIHDFEIFDLVPTSTWRKFATYMHDAGPREDEKPMIHIEICDVRPVPELTASELVIRVSVKHILRTWLLTPFIGNCFTHAASC